MVCACNNVAFGIYNPLSGTVEWIDVKKSTKPWLLRLYKAMVSRLVEAL